MWFIFITARLFIFLSFQPRLAATLLRSCSAVNNLIRRTGLSPAFQPTSLAQPATGFEWGLIFLRSRGLPPEPLAALDFDSDRNSAEMRPIIFLT